MAKDLDAGLRRDDEQCHWATRRILWLALRASGFADVRFGILTSQSGFRLLRPRNDKALDERNAQAMDGRRRSDDRAVA
jgi:hypothetical protein